MFGGTNNYSLSDIAAVSRDDGIGGSGSWIWILLIVILFGGWGYGNGWANGGGRFGGTETTSVYEGYVLNNDMSMLSRQLSDGFSSQERKLDSISNGICSLGYDQLAQMNGINTSIMTVGNAIQTQLADCCCKTQQNIKDTQYVIGSTGADISRGVERGFADTNYNLATQANGINTAIANGFCQTNFNAQTNTRDIVDSQNAGTRAILDKLCQMEANAKDEKIAEQAQQISALQLAASQAAQNNYLVDKLGFKTPVPSFSVPAPWYTTCGCNQGCGC